MPPEMASLRILLFGLVALVPVVFYRGVSEVFEFPKTELLATGALLLVAAALAGEAARACREGLRAWARSLPERAISDMRRDPLGAAVLLFLLSAALSTAASIRPELSLFGAHESEAGLKTAFATAGIYFASRSFASDARWLDSLARAAALAVAVASSYALLQAAQLDPFAWTRSATIGAVRRVPGTLGHANHLGGFIAMSLPLLAWLTYRTRALRERLIWIGIAALSLAALAATLSRGAWLACAAGLAASGLLAWRARRGSGDIRARGRLVAAALLLGVAAFLAPLVSPLRSELLTRWRQIADIHAPSTQSRFHLWRAGIQMAAEHPVLGVGTDSYIAAFPRYRTAEFWRIQWNELSAKAHDEVIQVAATQGTVGLLAAFLVVLFASRAILRVSRGRDGGAHAGAAASAGTLAAFAVHDLASFTVVATGTLAAAVAGWVAGVARAADSHDAPAAEPRRPGRSGASSGARLAGFLAAAFLWAGLVLVPWLAERAAMPGLESEMGSSARALSLARAHALAPWDARYAAELGRTRLTEAFSRADSASRWPRLNEAREAFQQAARIAPENGEIRALLARTLAAQASIRPDAVPLERIREVYSGAIEREPASPNVLELAAQGYLELGLTADARAYALRCVRLYPDFAMPMADLGVAALLEGRPGDAADTLTLALQRNWHGEESASMAAKSNYIAALREMRLREILDGNR